MSIIVKLAIYALFTVLPISLPIALSAGAEPMIIHDFNTKAQGQWSYVSDQVMGGVSEGSLSFIQDESQTFAHMTGNVSTENNGGFIQFRTNVKNIDKKQVQGIYLNVRGNSEKYYIHLRTSGTLMPWHYYASDFVADKAWQTIKLPLDSFLPSSGWLRNTVKRTGIKSLGVVAFGRDHKADIQVAEIGFY
jgi:hypothetical protein